MANQSLVGIVPIKQGACGASACVVKAEGSETPAWGWQVNQCAIELFITALVYVLLFYHDRFTEQRLRSSAAPRQLGIRGILGARATAHHAMG